MVKITRDARRATRDVCGGEKALRWLKVNAHRTARRTNRALLRSDAEDYEEYVVVVTGWDVW
jgi:hypothetical protein